MSKGGGKTVETRQDTSPWAAQQPYLQNLFSRAEGLYGRPTVAAQSPFTQQAIQARAAEAGPNSLTGQAQNQFSKTLAGDYLNPYAQGALGDVMDMTRSKINSQFQGDSYGNSAHQEWLGRGLMSAGAPFASQLYENERGRQMGAAQMAPGIANAGLGQLQQAGAMQDQYQQRLTDSPWDALQRYQGATAGNYGGQQRGTEPYSAPNDFMNAATLATMIALGSDRRLKRDIKKVGMHRIGVPLYSFRYLYDETPRIGVMADELEAVMPEAVLTDSRGFQMVNYAMLERGHG
jgi:hypothetical protein